MTLSEPYGTTPFPTLTKEARIPCHVFFNPSECIGGTNGNNGLVTPQQPQAQQIAVFEATPNEESIHGASVVAVNQHFVCYAVKNGLIRVLHRHSTLRTLLRSHSGQRITDIQFFQDGDVLATAGSYDDRSLKDSKTNGSKSIDPQSRIVIWRVFERSPEIMAEKLLEIETNKFTISRVVWHPFNPNQFWVVHQDKHEDKVATLVETTRIATIQHPTEQHALCSLFSDFCIMKDGIQLKACATMGAHMNLTDLCWNGRDSRHVLSVFDCGKIVLWDLKESVSSVEGVITPRMLGEVLDDSDGELCRCIFLPHEDSVTSSCTTSMLTTCFVTASQNNSCITLWSGWNSDGKLPSKIQRISIDGSAIITSLERSSYILDVCFGPAPADASPPSCFIVAADREAGRLFAFHCSASWSSPETSLKKPLLAGCDYVVPFSTKHPTYSWSVVCAPTQDISEEELSEQGGLIFDMKLFSYQSTVVQCLTLTSYMCLPPESTWSGATFGVLVKPLVFSPSPKAGLAPVSVSDLESEDEVLYDEDYEIEDDEDEEENEFEGAPEASALPSPEGLPNNSNSSDAGAFGSLLAHNPFANWLGAIASKPPGAAPPPLPQPPLTGVHTQEAFLSPMEILAGTAAGTTWAPLGGDPAARSTMTTANSFKSLNSGSGVSSLVDQEPLSNAIGTDANTGSSKSALIARSSVPTVEESIQASQFYHATRQPSESNINSVAPVNSEIIREIVREEFTNSIVSTIRQVVIDAIINNGNDNRGSRFKEDLSSSVAPLQRSIDSIVNNGVPFDRDLMTATVSQSLHEPIRVAFAECIRTVLIPTFESLSGHIIAKVTDSIEVSTTQQQRSEGSTNREIESMSKQLSTMTQLVAKLTDEVQYLRRDVASVTTKQITQVSGSAVQVNMQNKNTTPVDTLQARRNEILAHLRECNFEAAFTKAIAASTAEMVVFCCRNADLNKVLGGTTSVLSQPILLCLLQQLGTVLVASQASNMQLEMEWLQEIALSLNPTDASIQRHVPGVFQQVVSNLNQKLKFIQGTDQNQLRRQIQRTLQLLRGLPVASSVPT